MSRPRIDREGPGEDHKPIWAGPGTGNKSLLNNPGAWAAASYGWDGWGCRVDCLLPLSLPPEATCFWLRALQAHIPIRGPTTAAAHSLPAPGIEPRRPVPRPPQPGSQKQNPASFQKQRTPPPSREGKSPPDARLEDLVAMTTDKEQAECTTRL